MGRWHVHVVHMRARDIRVGDVVARDPSRFDGWFRVHEIRQLGDGTFNVLDKANQLSFTARPFDLIGLQTPVQLPAEAERNARTEDANRPGPVSDANAGVTPSSDASTGQEDDASSSPAARREAAAREAMARGEAGGGARALPGA